MARERIVVLIAVALSAAFALGWWLRGPSTVAPAASSAPEPGVLLELDAGAIDLLPDASLELRPIDPPDAQPP